ncbi:aldo/keto reductase [Halomonas sp. MCCC 1A17488]|uniref:Aldo/keto reductase n=1 Tax=Billgrantia sulfidoxydans TaxID=2733484 RepID=A0ABX7W1H5_9GAMM|nr:MULTISPECIES: aldo/keto reductase [Halomonas]MCE8016052.1 aldo/keto reductase [Halomonas sp. MCCC 1A17488]MCG3239385.1 aldo/keto reductase [Halomonas sp. MCCC 1A17488]QPP50685.1 aldo/keto reductase [Halomonas sp. SS10-MC5]QTP54264.1 aldo/keto reductase [Halomonas sulfidoxydans]
MSRQSPHVTLTATVSEAAIRLPAIGQGTWYMGEGLAPRRDEVRALQHGLELGLTLIDTAEMYADGGAEEVVGEALAGRRDQAFLVSKVYPWNAGRDSAIAACERSLTRLGTDRLDLYLLHWPGDIPLEETLEAFERLREQGKIRRFGVSNFDADEIETLHALPGGSDCAVNQVLYHLGSRGTEYALRPLMRRLGMPLMAYCPLAQAGKLRQDLFGHPVVREVADGLGVTPAQLLLAWTIRPVEGERDVIAIPKAVQPQHVEQNAGALTVELDDATLARLDEAFPAPDRKEPLDIV